MIPNSPSIPTQTTPISSALHSATEAESSKTAKNKENEENSNDGDKQNKGKADKHNEASRSLSSLYARGRNEAQVGRLKIALSTTEIGAKVDGSQIEMEDQTKSEGDIFLQQLFALLAKGHKAQTAQSAIADTPPVAETENRVEIDPKIPLRKLLVILGRQITVIVAVFGPAGLLIYGANSANLVSQNLLESETRSQEVVRNIGLISALLLALIVGEGKTAGDRWSGKIEFTNATHENRFVAGDSLLAFGLIMLGSWILKTQYADIPDRLKVQGYGAAQNLLHGLLKSKKSPLAAAFIQIFPAVLRYLLREFFKFGAAVYEAKKMTLKSGEQLAALWDNANVRNSGRWGLNKSSAKSIPDSLQRILLAFINSYGWTRIPLAKVKNPDFAGPMGALLSGVWTLLWENSKRFLIAYVTQVAVPKPTDSAKGKAKVQAQHEQHAPAETFGKIDEEDAGAGEAIFGALSESSQNALRQAVDEKSSPEELERIIDAILAEEMPRPDIDELSRKLESMLKGILEEKKKITDQAETSGEVEGPFSDKEIETLADEFIQILPESRQKSLLDLMRSFEAPDEVFLEEFQKFLEDSLKENSLDSVENRLVQIMQSATGGAAERKPEPKTDGATG